MDTNTFILSFSIFIFSTGIIMFVFMSKQFTQQAAEKAQNQKEGGPRAYLFHKLDEFFSEAEDMPTELMDAKKSDIKKIIDEMD